MRFTPIAIVLVVLSAAVCRAQDQSPGKTTETQRVHELESYLVRLTEFRLNDAADLEPETLDVAAKLEELKKSGKLELIETVQVSALAGHESVAMFGRSVAVTMGATTSQFGKQRTMQERRVGTQVQLTASPHNGKVAVKVKYETSRLSDNETEDSPPDTLTTQCNTTVLLEQELPKLLMATSANGSAYLLISITKR